MQPWEQLVWDRATESDTHTDGPRNPYQSREVQIMHADFQRRKPRLTDFVSQYAIGDNQACSLELLVRSRRLLEDSRAQMLKVRMRLLMHHSEKTVQ